MKFFLLANVLALLGCSSLSAHIVLPPVFGSNMVLQRQKEIPIWGHADAGERITVTLDTEKGEAVGGPDGHWLVKLPAREAGGPYTLTVQGNDTVTLTNVMVGEVWLCSGQSNMELSVEKALNGGSEISQAGHPLLRLFNVPYKIADQPQSTGAGQWVECSPQTVPHFSAVAYFFGRELQQELNVPVGLIEVSWGGTGIESWMSREALHSDPEFQPILDNFSQLLANYPQAQAAYEQDLPKLTANWQAAVEKAKSAGQPPPPGPSPPMGPGNRFTPSGIYNGEITPLAPFAIRGVVWYQGEHNSTRARQYRKLLPAFIQDWRRLWGEVDLPFLLVQLPNFGVVKTDFPRASAWAELREAQAMALCLPHTSLAVTIDLGVEKDAPAGTAAPIHPRNKQDVGHRLALLAEEDIYGKNVEGWSPSFKSMQIEGDSIRVTFDHAEGLKTRDGGAILGFALAGEDRKFFWATGILDQNSVVLRSDAVKKPVAVRYDWADAPNGNLDNAAGLPARPFRTDDWPGVSLDQHDKWPGITAAPH